MYCVGMSSDVCTAQVIGQIGVLRRPAGMAHIETENGTYITISSIYIFRSICVWYNTFLELYGELCGVAEEILVCDMDNNSITAIDMEGHLIRTSGAGVVSEPWAIAITEDGLALVTEHARSFARSLQTCAPGVEPVVVLQEEGGARGEAVQEQIELPDDEDGLQIPVQFRCIYELCV